MLLMGLQVNNLLVVDCKQDPADNEENYEAEQCHHIPSQSTLRMELGTLTVTPVPCHIHLNVYRGGEGKGLELYSLLLVYTHLVPIASL